MLTKYKWVYQSSADSLINTVLPQLLENANYEIEKGKNYIYAPGSIPIMLVAHVDTVHFNLPDVIFHDKVEHVMWSPNGIGGDDRSGISAIIELISRGHKPHILFTDGEEKGGIGAQEAAKFINPDVFYVIELDRKGKDDAVFYDCDNANFTNYILNFGFTKSYGTFTDISFTCPRWGIAGVNLSIGYYNAHQLTEYVKLIEWEATIEKVENMLKNPPAELFEYRETKGFEDLNSLDFHEVDYLGSDLLKNAERLAYGHKYYDSYDGQENSGYDNEIFISISAEDLASIFEGSEEKWEEFILDYGEALQYEALTFILEMIESLHDDELNADDAKYYYSIYE